MAELVARAAVERRTLRDADERAVGGLGRRMEEAIVEREREERAHHRLELVVVGSRLERVRVEQAAAPARRVEHASPADDARARVAAAGVLDVLDEARLEPRVAPDARRALERSRALEDARDRGLVDVDAVRAARVLAEAAAQASREVTEQENPVVDASQDRRTEYRRVLLPETPNHR